MNDTALVADLKERDKRYKDFEPSRFFKTIKVKGGGTTDYLPARGRIAWMRYVHPDAQVSIELLQFDAKIAVVKATIIVAATGASAEDVGQETANDFPDFLEKASTKAISRACAVLGFGTEMATELDEEEVSDAPVNKPTPKPAPANKPTPAKPAPKPAAVVEEEDDDEEEDGETIEPQVDDKKKYGDEARTWTTMSFDDAEDFAYTNELDDRVDPKLLAAIVELADRNKMPLVNLIRYVRRVEAEAIQSGIIETASNFINIKQFPQSLASKVVNHLLKVEQEAEPDEE